METFDIGFIPSGWKKGERLELLAANPTARGTISQDFSCRSVTEQMPTDAIAFLHFGYGDEADKAKEWLGWWFET